MTPDEIVACVDEMRALADIAERHTRPMMCGHYRETDPETAARYARAAFHEAAKLLDFCAPKTCGTCAHVLVRPGHGDFGDWLRCGCEYAPAYLSDVTYTECCRSWRRKEVPSDCA